MLLYDLAHSSEEAVLLGLEIAKKTEHIKLLEGALSELNFVRENNNTELLKNEQKVCIRVDCNCGVWG